MMQYAPFFCKRILAFDVLLIFGTMRNILFFLQSSKKIEGNLIDCFLKKRKHIPFACKFEK